MLAACEVEVEVEAERTAHVRTLHLEKSVLGVVLLCVRA